MWSFIKTDTSILWINEFLISPWKLHIAKFQILEKTDTYRPFCQMIFQDKQVQVEYRGTKWKFELKIFSE